MELKSNSFSVVRCRGASLIGKDTKKNEFIEKVYSEFKGYGWFEDYTYKKNEQNKFFNKDATMKLPFCKY